MSEIKKASFWLSQLFILLATVVGVFLAANQGYKQAVQFENMTTYKENYYLQKSLEFELTDNIAILKSYMTKIQDPNYFGARNEPLNFYNLIWENMKFSSATLGTPPEFLRETQRFYREVNRIHDEVAKGNIAVPNAIKLLNIEVENVEKNLIPGLQKSSESIKKELSSSDVIL